MYLEGGGGGNEHESYELAAYFYNTRCDLGPATLPFFFCHWRWNVLGKNSLTLNQKSFGLWNSKERIRCGLGVAFTEN